MSTLLQGYAFVEFVERTEAEQAQLYLDGGQVRPTRRETALLERPLLSPPQASALSSPERFG